MDKSQLVVHLDAIPRRRLALFAAAMLLMMVFSVTQPAGAYNSIASVSGSNPTFLGGIYKSASEFVLSPGEVMTYTIHLGLGPQASYQADVTDPLPVGLDYVAGSVNQSGVYDASTRTISWTGVAVSGSPVNLTFDVKDTATIAQPAPVVNTATITINGLILQREAWVMLLPGLPPANGLEGSFKSASPVKLGSGGTETYTIHLINSGAAAVSVNVSDPVPTPLGYVDGSASSGGVYDPTTHTVTWSNISIPSKTPVLLTFSATAPVIDPAPAARPAVITNTATITSGALSFTRSAIVLLTPFPVSPLSGSFKMASRREVSPGEKFTYTIYLHNSSEAPVTAAVSDVLPAEVSYVDGSANAGGTYDSATRTLTWTDLTVPGGGHLDLTFDAIAENISAAPTPRPIIITNTASISSDGVTLQRSARTLLRPGPGGDNIPPVVTSFIIGDQDVYTSPDVTLHIAATDNVMVSSMFIEEWALATKPFPHWQQVKTSGWVPYQTTYPWTMSNQSGAHFIGVWVADSSKNRSRLTFNAIDFASLVLPGAHVNQGDMVPYLVYYPAGVQVTAALNVLNGAADLFVWHPGNMFAPDETSPTPTPNPQTISFTTKTAGVYLFLVFGKQASDYDLSITPAGGPRVPVPTPFAAVSPTISNNSISGSSALDGLSYNPILPQSGLDPLAVAQDPIGPFFQSYLPAVNQ